MRDDNAKEERAEQGVNSNPLRCQRREKCDRHRLVKDEEGSDGGEGREREDRTHRQVDAGGQDDAVILRALANFGELLSVVSVDVVRRDFEDVEARGSGPPGSGRPI